MGPGAEERPAWANRPAAGSVVTPGTDQFKSCPPASALCSLKQLTGSQRGGHADRGILQRRKARSGHSLELHARAICVDERLVPATRPTSIGGMAGSGTYRSFAFNMGNGSYSLKSDNGRSAAAARRSARPPLLGAAGSSFSPLGGSHLSEQERP